MAHETLEIALATQNEGKIREIMSLLEDLPVRLRPASALGDIPDVDETESSLQGNAIKKAQSLFDFSGLPALADDTGLEVDALNGRPGVRSARFAGETATDADNRALLLAQLDGVDDRSARFCTVAAYIDGDGIYLFEGTCEGRIRNTETGSDGFGYDTLFEPEGCDVSFAEMSLERKNAVSHRGTALAKFQTFLQERISRSR